MNLPKREKFQTIDELLKRVEELRNEGRIFLLTEARGFGGKFVWSGYTGFYPVTVQHVRGVGEDLIYVEMHNYHDEDYNPSEMKDWERVK